MKLQSVYVSNLFGARRVYAANMPPVSLFAGKNGASKSSIAQAIRLAFTGQLARVELKKDAKAMVHDGAKSGNVRVDYDDTQAAASVTKTTLKASAATTLDTTPMRIVLGGQLAGHMSANELRAALFELMKVKVDPRAVMREIMAAGHTEDAAMKVAPLLRSGFPEACSAAREEASQARGAWKALTGENYGSEKAETWAAPAVDCPPEGVVLQLRASADEIGRNLSQAREAVGRADALLRETTGGHALRQRLATEAATADELAAELAAVKTRLEADEPALAQARQQAGEPPAKREGLIHELAAVLSEILRESGDTLRPTLEEDAEARLWAYEAQHGKIETEAQAYDPEAAERAQQLTASVAKDQREVVRLTQAIASAAEASRLLRNLDKIDTVEAVEAMVRQARAMANDAEAAFEAADSKAREAEASVKAAAEAERKTKHAAAAHAAVKSWTAIEALLAPDGLPARYLAKAIGPVNERLAQTCVDLEWPAIKLQENMVLTWADRPYSLLSKSEQWRVNVAMAEAVSHLSGLRVLVIDELDIVNVAERANIMGWLAMLEKAGELDSAVVLATLTTCPDLGIEGVTSYWVEDGICGPDPDAAGLRQTAEEPQEETA